MDDATKVESVELTSEILDLATGLETGIAVLPLDVVDGQGVYPEQSVMLVKELRALGAEAEYAHTSAQRVFEVKKSAEVLLVAYVIGIASSASWDLMKQLLRRWKDARLSVTYVELQEGHDRRGTSWKVEGNVDGVIRAIDALRDQSLPSQQAGDDEPHE